MINIYGQDGVNVSEGDKFSAFAGTICKATYQNSRFIEVQDFSRGHFRGPRGFQVRNLPKGIFFDLAPDGVGTKVALIDAANAHRRAAQDILAMCNGDITRWGGLPLVFTNVLDVNTLGKTTVDAAVPERLTNKCLREMLSGMGDVAAGQDMVFYKGETAELGTFVGSENPNAITKFNWAGTSFGVYPG